MIVTVPAETPVTTPEVGLTVAIAVLLLLHVPPTVESKRVIVPPTHTLEEPIITDMVPEPVTVMVLVVKQPVVSIYVIVHVPAETPVTKPDVGLIVAIDVLELLHVPPVVASVSVIVPATATVLTPPIVEGLGFTTIVLVTWLVPTA